MKISITKKITGMVVGLVFVICLIVGIVTANITRTIITDEIELQLKTGAFSVSQTVGLCITKEEMDADIKKLHEYTDIDVTIFRDNIRVASTVSGAVGTEMDKGIYKKLQSGENYFATNANVNGEEYFGYYIPFFKDGEFTGAIFTGISQEEADGVIVGTSVKIIGCILGYGLIISIVSFFIVKKITKSIKALEKTIGTLLDNDLATKHEKYKIEHDELQEICNKTVDFSNQLGERVVLIKDSADDLKNIAIDLKAVAEATTNTSNEIAKAIEEVAHGAVEQADETTNATYKISDMSNELGNIKNNVDKLHNITDSMNNAKVNVLETLSKLQDINTVMAKDVESTNSQVSITNESVQRIKSAVDMINDITDQISLLSINSAIEAAHAGDSGRGFAVIAQEIGKLANQSASSSNEIERILDELAKNYALIIDNVNNTTNNMNIQNNKLSETQDVFTVLENNINDTVQKIVEINTMVDNIDKEIKAMVDVISSLSAISEENSASTQETMASIEELNATINQVYDKAITVDDSADSLIDNIKIFKTE